MERPYIIKDLIKKVFVKEKYTQASVFTFGLKKRIKVLKNFLPKIRNIDFFAKDADCILGWGHKEKSNFARKRAKNLSIPYYALEDGFINSIGLNGESCPASSLVVDKRGIYYNPITPSDLENTLENKEFSKNILERASECIDFIKEHRITKYNVGLNIEETKFKVPIGNNILLIDQTVNDASVTLGSRGREDFDRMYSLAKEKFPSANIIIKTHPDVISGKKKGYLTKYLKKVGVYPLVEQVNIYSLAPYMDAIFTVTSLTGMEALIAGARVFCFGKPFYAGWGLTKDAKKFKRRTRKLTLEELFAGAYINYSRYLNPYNKQLCEIEEFLTVIAEILSQNKRLKKPLYCTGFTYWKRDNIRKLLKTPYNKIRFCWSDLSAVNRALKNGGEVLVWASKESAKLAKLCEEKNVKLKRVEDGFIRSIDIGSNLTPALSLVVDDLGIYYDANRESRLERILTGISLTQAQKERARDLAKFINDNSITKYNLQSSGLKLTFPRDKKIILVPGQVEDDASILTSKSRVKTNRKLLEDVRRREKDSFIIFKPHPDVLAGNRKGHLPKKIALQYADLIIENINVSDLVRRCDKVYTISSLVGFEALMKEKEVYTYGSPFYAGWGLTNDENRFSKRKKLDIETLIYGTLISYPRYIDPISGILCQPELLIERISRKRNLVSELENKSKRLKLFKFIKNTIKEIKRNF